MPDDVPRLARLDRVSVEDVWSSEPRQFTPWLASEENLRLLGETIDMDLQVESQEHPVGPFSADIVCREVATNAPVLIENQLGRTDHTHLGQILTYAASLKAETIIWIANPFTEEHRAALEWLNEVTNGEISFFGIEIELWRIEGSPIAPRFNVVAKPWTKRIPPDPVLTDSRRLQLEFWTAFHSYVSEHSKTLRPTKPLPQNWMNLAIGRSGFGLAAVASLSNSEKGNYETNEVRAEFVITASASDKYFSILAADRDQIEKDLGYPLVWHNPPAVAMKKCYIRREVLLEDRAAWSEIHGWLLGRLEDLRRVFSRKVKDLKISEATPPMA